ncbi:MAG: RNA polymerase subunit sigma [Deltaproteobacteria bacterium]|nr:RNA polymerase subunit sigma [Deltaproteobacteria bacterium]
MHEHSSQIDNFLNEFCPQLERLVFLTGAGISAESGIPTFRGEEGYWTIGSKVYQPQEMATWNNFSRMPLEVWRWYLHRRAICHKAEPNPAHHALADLEQCFGDGFTLVTQNVDGLHLRAGNTFARTYQIHGNIDYMRPYQGDSSSLVLVPVTTSEEAVRQLSDDALAEQLQFDEQPQRPHVLWFDECYDEDLYRFQSSLEVTSSADLLVIVGTSGATNLPNQMVTMAARAGIPFIDINPAENVFGQRAQRLPHGLSLQGSAGDVLPILAKALSQHKTD